MVNCPSKPLNLLCAGAADSNRVHADYYSSFQVTVR